MDEFKEKYPILYKHINYFDCGPGWNSLLHDLSGKLERLIEEYIEEDESGYVPSASQVKEKHGSLRFYMNMASQEMWDEVEKAEQISKCICEKCGELGHIEKVNGWLYCRCEDCFANMCK